MKGFQLYLQNKLASLQSGYATNLKSQQAFINLSSLQASLAVGTRSISPPLVPCQVDQGELAVHLVLPTKNYLEYSVAARRVGVGRRLPRCSGQDKRERRQELNVVFILALGENNP